VSDLGRVGADFESHRIQGYVRGQQGLTRLSVPLISHVEGNLWQGGCIHGVRLTGGFRYVLSLYQDERYVLEDDCERVDVWMLDALDQSLDEVEELARQVVGCVERGKTLVHCQAGLNRSGLVTARALMLMGRSAREAIDLLREKRCPLVLCNEAFEAWLLALDAPAEVTT
jgi:protein-tyrosine phosphatase